MEKELINSEEANTKTTENIKKLNEIRLIDYAITLSNIKDKIKEAIDDAIEKCEYSCDLNIGNDRIEYNNKHYDWERKDIDSLIKEIREFLEQFNYKCEVKKSGYIGHLVDIKIDWSK